MRVVWVEYPYLLHVQQVQFVDDDNDVIVTVFDFQATAQHVVQLHAQIVCHCRLLFDIILSYRRLN